MKTLFAAALLATSFSAFAGDRADSVEGIPTNNYSYETVTVTNCYKTSETGPAHCYTQKQKRNYKAGPVDLDNVSGGR